MKICAVQWVFAMLLGGMAIAHPNYGQLLERKVTLNVQQVTIQQAIHHLEEASGVRFFYSNDKLEFLEKVSIEASGEALGEVLDKLLLPYKMDYTVYENEMVIILKYKNRNQTESVISPKPSSAVHQVTGIVKDATGQPLAGVNVIVRGTTNGVTTDAEGHFSLEAEDTDVLVFSFIGYTSVEKPVKAQAIIDVILTEDVRNLNEVVINAGYYETNEKEQTGNISRITSKDIAKQPVSDPLAAMAGRMPGVYIAQTTGIPGSAFTIQIRGQNSLRNNFLDNGNLPLYVIDGVPYNSQSPTTGIYSSVTNYGSPLNSINPNDIESIEVLKDADATSIYGSRGANGVVLITTKQGKTGKTHIDVNAYSGVAGITRTMDLLNTKQYISMRKEAYRNDNVVPTTIDAKDLLVWDTVRNTNWQKKLIGGTARTFNVQTSISGGNELVQFLFSGNYFRQTTVFPGSFAYDKGAGHFNLNQTSANRKFKLSLTSSYVIDNNNLANFDPTTAALTLPPNAPDLTNPDGTLNWDALPISNPLASLLQKYVVKTNNLLNNLQLSREILPGLEIKTSFGNNVYTVDEVRTTPAKTFPPAYGITSGGSRFVNSKTSSWIIEPQLAYKKNVGNGKLQLLLGSTFQETVRNLQALSANGFQDDNSLENIGAAGSVTVDNYTHSKYRYNAVFARANYNYQEKYLINITARRDGSSRFGPGHRFGNFGAVGAAWIFSNEALIKNSLPVLSFGKVRSSYGTTGSDQIADYAYLDSYSYGASAYLNVKGLNPTRLANKNYSWESNRKFEVALDLGFIQDRIMLSTSFYSNRSSNQLVGYSLPSITGFATVQANLPAKVQNTGFEFLLRTVVASTQNFKWSANLNLTIPRNKLLSYPDLASSSYSDTYAVGKPLSIRKTFLYNGVNPTTGIYQLRDLDGDGVYDYTNDRVFSKKVGQDFYGGLQNSITFHNFQVDIFLQFVKQTGPDFLSSYAWPGIYGNQSTYVLNHWRKPGDVAPVEKFSQGYNDGADAYFTALDSDRTIVDASFIRLKNVSVSYNFPAALNRKIKMESSRIYFQGQNLLTVTGYKGLDPENTSAFSLPPLRVLTVGLQFTF